MKTFTMNLLFQCNAKCAFCVAGIPDQLLHIPNVMSREEVLQELERGKQNGFERVVFSGGEPTIHPNLIEAIRVAKDMGFRRIDVKTNGIRFGNLSYAQEVIEAGVTHIGLAVQGPSAEIHDRIVGVRGAFDTINNVTEFFRQFEIALYSPTCIQKSNYTVLPNIAEYLHKKGFKGMTLAFIEPSGSAGFNFSQVVPRYAEVLPFVKEAIQVLKNCQMQWTLHGFPFCMIPAGAESHSMDLFKGVHGMAGGPVEGDDLPYEKDSVRVKSSHCQECYFNGLCGGVWSEYIQKCGWDELSPIQDKLVTDVIPMEYLLFRMGWTGM